MGGIEEWEMRASFQVSTVINRKRICPVAIDLFLSVLKHERQM